MNDTYLADVITEEDNLEHNYWGGSTSSSVAASDEPRESRQKKHRTCHRDPYIQLYEFSTDG